MENSIQIFKNSQFGEIRTAGSAEAPMFCLADVCRALGLSAKGVNQRLSEEVISNYPLQTAGGTQQALFVNEDGLYDVILDSRKPEAKQFRKWVTSEVLPTIRKTGGYLATSQEDTPELIMARALQVAQRTIDSHKQQLQIAQGTIEAQQEELKAIAPLADYTREVLQSTSTFTATQIAKDLGMSAVTLNSKLRRLGVQFYQSGQWFLTAKYQGRGYTDMRIAKYVDSRTDEVKTSQSLVWTERGRLFINTLSKEGRL
jgi:prophage antirepressor-like protein